MSRRLRVLLLTVLVAILAAGSGVLVRQTLFRPQTITAYFSSATGLYPGDEVRIAGVKVGTIRSITPQPEHAAVTLEVRSRRGCAGRRQGGDRGAEPGGGPLRSTRPALPGRRASAHGRCRHRGAADRGSDRMG